MFCVLLMESVDHVAVRLIWDESIGSHPVKFPPDAVQNCGPVLPPGDESERETFGITTTGDAGVPLM